MSAFGMKVRRKHRQEESCRFQHSINLRQGLLGIQHVLKYVVTQDRVEGIVRKREELSNARRKGSFVPHRSGEAQSCAGHSRIYLDSNTVTTGDALKLDRPSAETGA